MKWIRRLGSFALAVGLVLLTAVDGWAQQQVGDDRAERVVRHTWTADRREFSEGDVVTILVDEATLATTRSDNTSSRDRSRRLGANAGVTGGGAGVSLINADASTNATAASHERGEATRRERFTTDITTHVVEISPNGLMRIEGKKALKIDAHEQVITLRGWVRPADISAGNVVESWRVANIEIVYESNGELARPRQSLISRILGWLWP